MSNQKIKSESYAQLGGINAKASPYVMGPAEFLDLVNYDFFTPGSLSQRWGSTQYLGQTYPGQINSLFEFARLDGSSFVVSSFSGGIHSGATTGNAQGLSLTTLLATLSSFYYPVLIKGATSQPIIQSSKIFQYLGNQGQLIDTDYRDAPNYFFANPQSQSDNIMSYAVLNNFLFMADGSKFLKYDGTTTYPVGLPPPLKSFGSSNIFIIPDIGTSTYFSNLAGASDYLGFGMSGNFYGIYCSYVNNRGFEGPLWPLYQVENSTLGSTAAAAGGTLFALRFALHTPLSYGISAIKTYVYSGLSSMIDPATGFVVQEFWNLDPALINVTPASGSTITWVVAGTTTGGQSLLHSNLAGPLASSVNNGYFPIGLTAAFGQLGGGPNVIQEYDMPGFFPRYLEIFQNRLFAAGFSAMPSQVWFSDLSEPEGYAPNFNFEVRTNDGDYITAIKSYGTRFYTWKKNSFHVLIGDNPNNFQLAEVSDQYGCMNNRCAAAYNNNLVFLDRKGVILWDGANLTVLSQKIQPIFDTMNYSAALTQACMVHDKLRNQILVAIPVSGSGVNNLVCVYDYAMNAWTTYKNLSISSLAKIQGRNNTKNAFYGSYSGTINWFGPSFLSDNGSGYTLYFKSKFNHDIGESSQKMYRRLFLNADSPASSTLVFGINFFQDFGSSVVLGTTMVLSQFQNRIDFGISGKALAFEMSSLQTAIPIRIHGYTIESRLQRRV